MSNEKKSYFKKKPKMDKVEDGDARFIDFHG